MTIDDPDVPALRPYRDRVAIRPGDPPIAYRPGTVLVDEATLAEQRASDWFDPDRYDLEAVFAEFDEAGAPIDEPSPIGQWYRIDGVEDPVAVVERSQAEGLVAQLDVVWFANGCDCCGCPPHPAMAAELLEEGWGANPWRANPWRANPWRANPWRANPWRANPWRANPEELNVVATGRPPTSSVMPAPDRGLPRRPPMPASGIVVGVLDSGLAGGRHNTDGYRPALLGTDPASLARISGRSDVPSRSLGPFAADNYLDPVAGHGTFIAGIVEQLTPGCTIRVDRVVQPDGDVGSFELAVALQRMMTTGPRPQLVNLSFGGTGRSPIFEGLIEHYERVHGVVFVAAAGNEGSCVEQFPAALPFVVGVAALGPDGPAAWSNYGDWVDACAPGTDIVSCFFSHFDGDLPRINGMDSDDFDQWATWSGTSFAAPVVVAALAREMVATQCTAAQAADRLVHAPHLARLPLMGAIVNA